VSFFCKACGRQRAGCTADGEEVCDECRPTQAGRALLLLLNFEQCEIDGDDIVNLENVLDEAQNEPPLGEADGSFTEGRWTALRVLAKAARNFNAALENVQLSTSEPRP